MNTLYSDQLWKKWTERIQEKEKKSSDKKKSSPIGRTYPHFDSYVAFNKIQDDLKKCVVSGKLNFPSGRTGILPFLKYLDKTPRFKTIIDHTEEEEFRKFSMKNRPIIYSGHYDSYLFSFYSYALNHLYKKKLGAIGESVLAYRDDLNGQCNIQFAKEVFDELKANISTYGTYTAIGLDIKSYFDNIDHKRLKQEWLGLIEYDILPSDQYQLYKSLIHYRYVTLKGFRKHFNLSKWKIKNNIRNGSLLNLVDDKFGSSIHEKIQYLASQNLISSNSCKIKGKWLLKNKGIPQGNPMSSVLSNLFLYEFDKSMYEKSKTEGFIYRRYSDDILILCRTENAEDLAHHAKNQLESEFNLKINLEKADVVQFDKKKDLNFGTRWNFNQSSSKFVPKTKDQNSASFQYLGFEYNGQDVLIRSKSLSKFYRKMTRAVYREIGTYVFNKGTTDGFSTQRLTERYTHLGKRNFVTYALKAASAKYKTSLGIMDGLDSPSIKKQLSNHVDILNREVKAVIKVFEKELNKANKEKPRTG